MIGEVIQHKYRIIDQIGEDMVATVYLARDLAGDQVVALKAIRPRWAGEGRFLQRFRQEARLLQMLSAPQVIKVLDYGEHGDLAYVVQEYAPGRNLASYLEAGGPLEVDLALNMARQIALCLVDAHVKGVVHRDLRPRNVLVIAEDAVRVTDFGIAWAAELEGVMSSGEGDGPHYLSPEQVSGQEVDGRSDLYSLGAILFETLAGQRPYDADTAANVVLAHLQAPIPSLHQLDSKIPLEIDDLVSKCLAKRPDDRYQSAAEFLEAIDTALRMMAARDKSTAAVVDEDLVGRTLGAYRIVEQIGRGGMATVYKAYEPALDRYVAIKVLPLYFAHDPEFAIRFEREAKAVARLNHPNILPIYGYGQEGGLSYIVMRYVAVGTLREMLGRPLDLQTIAHILCQIGRALDHAHRQEIVHRDVKPSNVLMDEGRWALLTDFGLARMVESSVRLTKSGVGIGTPSYMSPEQGQGLSIDRRTDVYSLGVILYEMLTGQVPYEAETPMAVVLKHIGAPLPLPREINPAIPEVAERVILKAMAKDPEDRYQTAAEMVDALESAVADVSADVAALPVMAEPYPAPATPTEESLPRDTVPAADLTPSPAKGGRAPIPFWLWLAVGVVVVVLLGSGIGIGSYLAGRRAPTATVRPTESPIATATRVVQVVTATPVSKPTGTPTVKPTATPSRTVTAVPTATSTSTPPPTATTAPTATPTPTLSPTATLAPGATQVWEKDGAVMVYVPAGTFWMGSAAGDADADDNEKPQHEVDLGAFWIDRTEVTNAQYAAFLNEQGNQEEGGATWLDVKAQNALIEGGEGDYRPKGDYEGHPVIEVTWYGARAYCEWAGKRLPTEAEWEKAARGTDKRIYPWKGKFDCTLGNFDDEAQDDKRVVPGGPDCDGYPRTSPVGMYEAGASPYGALDMAGNVWEWTGSLEQGYPYDPADGREAAEASGPRALRGGSWRLSEIRARSTYRGSGEPDLSGGHIGFRCVLPIVEPES